MASNRKWRLIGAALLPVLLVSGLLNGCKAKQAAVSEQVLNVPIVAFVKGLDPADSSDLYANTVVAMLYEPLYQYNYLLRPVTLEPCLAAAMPQVSADGLSYEIELKPGTRFIDDPAFINADNPQGKGREVTAEDFIYSLKRLADPRVKSTGWWLFDGRIVGLNDFRAAAQRADATDYDLPVAGLQALAPHRLRIQLTRPYPQLLYALAMPFSAVVAREAVTRYGPEFINHPVGTGPFKLESFNRNLRIVLVKNPNYRQEFYPSVGEPASERYVGDAAAGLLADKGKALPLIDKVVLHFFQEAQPRWLNFMQGNLDRADIPKDTYDSAVDAAGELKPELKAKGIRLWKDNELDVTFVAFNMDDPLLGKNADLRRAISLAVDTEKRIRLLYNGRAISAQTPIPPGLSGYDPEFRNPYKTYDVEKAKQYLAKAGYPGGKGLPELRMESIAQTTQRQFDEIFVNEMRAIGITLKVNGNTWPEFISKINKRQAPIFSMAWGADYPDAENFFALFYSKNESPGSNHSNYRNPEFDKLYERVSVMSESPERTQLYKQMARIVVEDVPWVIGVHRLGFVVAHDWVRNYKPHPIRHGFAKYYGIDSQRRAERKAKF